MKKCLLMGICILCFGACVTTPKAPSWAGKSWTEKNTLYFSGISSGCTDVACAQQNAYQNAVSSLAEYIGTTVQVQTTGMLTNDFQTMQAQFLSNTEQLPLEKIKIEDFKHTADAQRITGYILISVDQAQVDAAKRHVEKQQQERAARLQRRKDLGPIAVQTPSGWTDLSGRIENLLNENGYIVAKMGTPFTVTIQQFSCSPSSVIRELQICSFQSQFSFKGTQNTFSTKGYGKSEGKAREEAVIRWVKQIPEDL